MGRAACTACRLCSSHREKVRARMASLRSSRPHRLRSFIITLRRTWASIHVGRRARALERYGTGLPIGLDLLVQRSATGAAVGVP